MRRYRAEYSPKGPSVAIYTDDDTREIAVLQGDEAVQLMIRLDNTHDAYTEQDVLSEYDYDGGIGGLD